MSTSWVVSSCLVLLLLATLATAHHGGTTRRPTTRRPGSNRPSNNPRLSCARFGRCCAGQNSDCKARNASPTCFCDEYCVQNDDCCLDYHEFCQSCEDDRYTNVNGKCLHLLGNNTYYYADRACKDEGARLFMPKTQTQWEAFISSNYYNQLIEGKTEFEYWIHCKYVAGAMHWQDGPRPGTLVTWSNFTSPPDSFDKKAGLVGKGNFDGDWGYSKQWKNLTTICEKEN